VHIYVVWGTHMYSIRTNRTPWQRERGLQGLKGEMGYQGIKGEKGNSVRGAIGQKSA